MKISSKTKQIAYFIFKKYKWRLAEKKAEIKIILQFWFKIVHKIRISQAISVDLFPLTTAGTYQ